MSYTAAGKELALKYLIENQSAAIRFIDDVNEWLHAEATITSDWINSADYTVDGEVTLSEPLSANIPESTTITKIALLNFNAQVISVYELPEPLVFSEAGIATINEVVFDLNDGVSHAEPVYPA